MFCTLWASLFRDHFHFCRFVLNPPFWHLLTRRLFKLSHTCGQTFFSKLGMHYTSRASSSILVAKTFLSPVPKPTFTWSCSTDASTLQVSYLRCFIRFHNSKVSVDTRRQWKWSFTNVTKWASALASEATCDSRFYTFILVTFGKSRRAANTSSMQVRTTPRVPWTFATIIDGWAVASPRICKRHNSQITSARSPDSPMTALPIATHNLLLFLCPLTTQCVSLKQHYAAWKYEYKEKVTWLQRTRPWSYRRKNGDKKICKIYWIYTLSTSLRHHGYSSTRHWFGQKNFNTKQQFSLILIFTAISHIDPVPYISHTIS